MNNINIKIRGQEMRIRLNGIITADKNLLRAISKLESVEKNNFGQKKKLYKVKPSLKNKEKKIKKTITMRPTKSEILKDLSHEFKVSQGDVVEKLLEMVSADYYNKNLDKKFRELFS